MKKESGQFDGRENKQLFYQKWLPESNDIKAYIIALHGWGAHSDRMEISAEYFVENGYGIYSFDLRGHWRNSYNSPGHIDSMDHLQKDVVLFMDLVRQKANDRKIFLMGQDFGGLISLMFAIEHPGLSGVIVTSPLLRWNDEMTFTKKIAKKISRPLSKLSPSKTIPLEINQNYLTSDLKILRKYISDKNKTKNISLITAVEIDRSMKWVLGNARKLTCPILILQAGNDNVVDSDVVRQFYDQLESQDKRFKLYEGFLHELLNEKGRAEVYRDIYIWLEKHL